MSLDTRMAKAFGLEGDSWQRHANPWSVYTRIPIPPLLAGPLGIQGGARRDPLGGAEGRPDPCPAPVAPNVLNAISTLGVPFIPRGLVVRNGWMACFGLAVEVAGKTWFIDRMAVLYGDVASATPSPQPTDARQP